LGLFALPQAVQGAALTVTRADDPVPDGCTPTDCSLREAIIAANADAGADTITIPAGTYTLAITGAGENESATGDLDVEGELILRGAGAAETIIDGNALDRVLDIRLDASTTIEGLTIRNGSAITTGNVVGGGIYNNGTLTLTEIVIVDNVANAGGGVFSLRTLTLVHTTVRGNQAIAAGITNPQGGGIFNRGTLRIEQSTLHSNSTPTEAVASQGGAIWNEGGDLTITNSTLSSNTSRSGGGLGNQNATARLTNITLAANRASDGGGVQSFVCATCSGSVTLTNTLLADNGSSNCSGNRIVSDGGNLDDTATCGFGATDVAGVAAQLGPLQDNGGATLTHAPGAASPALDAGLPGACPATDQRGLARPQDANGDGVAACDIGAVELPAGSVEPSPSPSPTPSPGPAPELRPAVYLPFMRN
jgi:CSLREA domain-containing protein